MNYPKNLLSPILDYFRKLEVQLLARKKTIASEDPFADTARLDDNADLGSEATEQFGHAQAAALEEETEEALQRVRGAMKRVEDGSYGKCVKCGDMIDTDRLGIDPTAELCMACAKKKTSK